jgi:uncharacterized OB-fold protein
MSDWKLPAPAANPETIEYWKAAKAGRLILKSCRGCGKPHFYPRSVCPFCYGTDLEWKETSGKGVVYSFSHMKAAADPYVMALVTLDEGPTMMTNIVDSDPQTLKIGDPVSVVFKPSEGEWPYPMFARAD